MGTFRRARSLQVSITAAAVLTCSDLSGATIAAAAARADDDPVGSLVIELTGMHSDEGAAVYAVWSGPQGWLVDGSIRSGSVPVADGVASVTLTGLPHGEYAVSVFHDVNGNGKLDTGLFGLPKEPIGTSNNARMRFRPPRYDDAVIVLDRPEQTITIGVRKIF